jgi:centrosomal protein CEP290
MDLVTKFNSQIEKYKDQITGLQGEMNKLLSELEKQKQLNSQSPTSEVKSIVDRLREQLAEKEQQQQALNRVLMDLKSDMVNIAKNSLISHDQNDQGGSDAKLQRMVEKMSGEYQDKLNAVGEELARVKKELKERTKTCDELKLEVDYLKSQIRSKDQRIKKLADDNQKLTDEGKIASVNKTAAVFHADIQSNDVGYLRKQIRILEEKLKKEKLNKAERPYEQSRSRV